MKFRLSLMYFAIFSFVGVHMPFWPVWLKSRGIDAAGIAALTALSFALKIVVTPWVSKRVDISGRKREAVIWLAFGLLAGCLLFNFTHGFIQILLLTTLAFASWSPIMSLVESITMVNAKACKLDYGRIRIWGSISFMVVAIFSGRLLAGFGEPVLLWSVIVAAALLFSAALLLPRTPPSAARPVGSLLPSTPPAAGSRPFVRSKWFLGFMMSAILIQGSHAAYYTFASIHWRDIGLHDETVGLLWGISLAAEIAFFAFGRPIVDRIGPINVIVLGGLAAALRWVFIGATADPFLLVPAQLLHALSFGASHFAAVRLISDRVDDSLSATGQGLYSAYVMGLGMGVFVLSSGPLYTAFGQHSFYLMSLVAAVGAAVMLATRRLDLVRISPHAPVVDPAGVAEAAVTNVVVSSSSRA